MTTLAEASSELVLRSGWEHLLWIIVDPVSGKLSHSWDMSDINDINVVASGHTGEVQQ
jgi:hypothetical protein